MISRLGHAAFAAVSVFLAAAPAASQVVFTDITERAGIALTGLLIESVAWGDYDNDLDFDLYWTSWPDVANAFYENRGGLEFDNVALASGTDDPRGWGISVNAGDVDLDGWQDFFVTNGFDNSSSPNALFLNDRDGSFTDITAAIGGGDFDGRGVAFADFDNDGDLDLVVTADAGQATRLWRNDSATGNHWLGLRLSGSTSNASAIGARVVEKLVVRWPSGTMQTLLNVAADQYLELTEPRATTRRGGVRRVPGGLRGGARWNFLNFVKRRTFFHRSSLQATKLSFTWHRHARSGTVTANPAPDPVCCR